MKDLSYKQLQKIAIRNQVKGNMVHDKMLTALLNKPTPLKGWKFDEETDESDWFRVILLAE